MNLYQKHEIDVHLYLRMYLQMFTVTYDRLLNICNFKIKPLLAINTFTY